MLKIVKRTYKALHNYKLGLLSFSINFFPVFAYQLWKVKSGFLIAGSVGLKQGFAAFWLGGFFGRITERFSEIPNPWLAYPLGCFVPTVLAHVLYAMMHMLTATPEPIESTLVSMTVSMLVYTPVTIFVLRRGFFKTHRPAKRGSEFRATLENKREVGCDAVQTPPEMAALTK